MTCCLARHFSLPFFLFTLHLFSGWDRASLSHWLIPPYCPRWFSTSTYRMWFYGCFNLTEICDASSISFMPPVTLMWQCVCPNQNLLTCQLIFLAWLALSESLPYSWLLLHMKWVYFEALKLLMRVCVTNLATSDFSSTVKLLVLFLILRRCWMQISVTQNTSAKGFYSVYRTVFLDKNNQNTLSLCII